MKKKMSKLEKLFLKEDIKVIKMVSRRDPKTGLLRITEYGKKLMRKK